jgi:hypothetical protein
MDYSKMLYYKPTPPVQTGLPTAASAPRSSTNKVNPKTDVKPDPKGSSEQPHTTPRRPAKLRIHFHPHPLKSTNKGHVTNMLRSLTPGAAPVETGLYIQSTRSLFTRGTKAPFTAARAANSKRDLWGMDTASFDELVDMYMERGRVDAVVRDTEGKKVKCFIALVGPGEKVPKGVWKIRVWKEPVKWVAAKWMAIGESFRKAKEEKRLKREMKARAEEKARELETESLDGGYEKCPWE